MELEKEKGISFTRQKLPKCVNIFRQSILESIMSSVFTDDKLKTMLQDMNDDDLIKYESKFRLTLLILQDLLMTQHAYDILHDHIVQAKLRIQRQPRLENYFTANF